MLKKLNRKFQDYLRSKRLSFGKYIWDRKKNIYNTSKDKLIDKNNIKSILVLRCDGKIGDMVISTILFREIKKKYPNIKLGVVSKGEATAIIKNNKNVDKIYNYSKKRSHIKKLASEIAKENYDLLVDFSENLKVNQMMLINLCKAKFNIGVNKNSWNLFDFSVDEINFNEHISNLYINMLKILGIQGIDSYYDIYLNKEEEKKSMEIKEEYILFNPYAASKHRSFNLEKSIKIIQILLEKRKEKIVLISTKNHRAELEKIKEKLGERIEVPKLNGILDVAGFIKNSKLVVTPDTSIVHISVAYDKELICVYRKEKEDKNSKFWGPNSKKAKVIFVEEEIKEGEEIDINKVDLSKIKKLLEKREDEKLNN